MFLQLMNNGNIMYYSDDGNYFYKLPKSEILYHLNTLFYIEDIQIHSIFKMLKKYPILKRLNSIIPFLINSYDDFLKNECNKKNSKYLLLVTPYIELKISTIIDYTNKIYFDMVDYDWNDIEKFDMRYFLETFILYDDTILKTDSNEINTIRNYNVTLNTFINSITEYLMQNFFVSESVDYIMSKNFVLEF